MKNIFEKIASNTIFSFLGWLVTALTSFITAPLLINKIGLEGYGLWAAFFIFIGFLNLLDLGFGSTITRTIAQHKQWAKTEIGGFLPGVFLYYAFAAGFSWLVISLFYPIIFQLLNLPEKFWQLAFLMFQLAPLYFLLERFHLTFIAVFNGLQKMYFSALANFFISLGMLTGTGLIWFFNHDLLSLTKTLLVSLGLVLIYDLLILAFNYWPKLSWVSWSKAKAWLKFGFQIQLNINFEQFSLQAFKFLVTSFFGLSILAFFELAYRLVLYLKSLIKLILPALFPTAAEVCHHGSRDQVLALTQKTSRYLILLVSLFFIGTGFLANDFFKFWLGQELPEVVMIIWGLLLGYFLDTSLIGVSTVLMGAGLAGVQAIYMLIFSGLGLFFGAVLGRLFGYQAMSLGYFFASLIAAPFLWRQFEQKICRLKWSVWQGIIAKTFLAGFIAGGATDLVSRLLPVVSIITFGLKGATFVLTYFLTLLVFSFFTHEDKTILQRFLKIFKRLT